MNKRRVKTDLFSYQSTNKYQHAYTVASILSISFVFTACPPFAELQAPNDAGVLETDAGFDAGIIVDFDAGEDLDAGEDAGNLNPDGGEDAGEDLDAGEDAGVEVDAGSRIDWSCGDFCSGAESAITALVHDPTEQVFYAAVRTGRILRLTLQGTNGFRSEDIGTCPTFGPTRLDVRRDGTILVSSNAVLCLISPNSDPQSFSPLLGVVRSGEDAVWMNNTDALVLYRSFVDPNEFAYASVVQPPSVAISHESIVRTVGDEGQDFIPGLSGLHPVITARRDDDVATELANPNAPWSAYAVFHDGRVFAVRKSADPDIPLQTSRIAGPWDAIPTTDVFQTFSGVGKPVLFDAINADTPRIPWVTASLVSRSNEPICAGTIDPTTLENTTACVTGNDFGLQSDDEEFVSVAIIGGANHAVVGGHDGMLIDGFVQPAGINGIRFLSASQRLPTNNETIITDDGMIWALGSEGFLGFLLPNTVENIKTDIQLDNIDIRERALHDVKYDRFDGFCRLSPSSEIHFVSHAGGNKYIASANDGHVWELTLDSAINNGNAEGIRCNLLGNTPGFGTNIVDAQNNTTIFFATDGEIFDGNILISGISYENIPFGSVGLQIKNNGSDPVKYAFDEEIPNAAIRPLRFWTSGYDDNVGSGLVPILKRCQIDDVAGANTLTCQEAIDIPIPSALANQGPLKKLVVTGKERDTLIVTTQTGVAVGKFDPESGILDWLVARDVNNLGIGNIGNVSIFTGSRAGDALWTDDGCAILTINSVKGWVMIDTRQPDNIRIDLSSRIRFNADVFSFKQVPDVGVVGFGPHGEKSVLPLTASNTLRCQDFAQIPEVLGPVRGHNSIIAAAEDDDGVLVVGDIGGLIWRVPTSTP